MRFSIIWPQKCFIMDIICCEQNVTNRRTNECSHLVPSFFIRSIYRRFPISLWPSCSSSVHKCIRLIVIKQHYSPSPLSRFGWLRFSWCRSFLAYDSLMNSGQVLRFFLRTSFTDWTRWCASASDREISKRITE